MEKKYFLTKDGDFKKVYRKRKTFGNRNFTLYVKRNGLAHSRMGFSINKKVGKAVVRNKIKRRLKALYQEAYPRLTPGYDYVIVVKNNVADLDFKTMKSAFYHLFRVSKFLKGGKKSWRLWPWDWFVFTKKWFLLMYCPGRTVAFIRRAANTATKLFQHTRSLRRFI